MRPFPYFFAFITIEYLLTMYFCRPHMIFEECCHSCYKSYGYYLKNISYLLNFGFL